MERERGLVKAEARTEAFPTAAEQILSRLQRQFPEIAQHIRQEVAVEPDAKEFTGLQADLEACISAAEKLGELNTRHPGFVNDRLQDVKRMMRRSLGGTRDPYGFFTHRIERDDAVHDLCQQAAAAYCAARTVGVPSLRRLPLDLPGLLPCKYRHVIEEFIVLAEVAGSAKGS